MKIWSSMLASVKSVSAAPGRRYSFTDPEVVNYGPSLLHPIYILSAASDRGYPQGWPTTVHLVHCHYMGSLFSCKLPLHRLPGEANLPRDLHSRLLGRSLLGCVQSWAFSKLAFSQARYIYYHAGILDVCLLGLPGEPSF